MKDLTNNSAVAEILESQTNEISKLDAEIDAAKTFTDLKKVAAKYPEAFKDYKGYKSFASLYEYMMDCSAIAEESIETTPPASETKPPKVKKVKAPKVKKVKEDSAFGLAIAAMCKNPELKYKELYNIIAKKGFDKPGAIRTAHSQACKIFSLLKINKLME